MKFPNDELPDILEANVPIESVPFIPMEGECTAFHHQDDTICPDPTCPDKNGLQVIDD